jgi:hypothetical protein
MIQLSLVVALALADADGGAEPIAPPPPEPVVAAPAPDAGSDVPVASTSAELTPAPAPPSAAELMAPSQGFIKGELSVYLGAEQLVVKNNRIGVSVGPELFENSFYARIEPQVDLRFLDGDLKAGFGVPLRFTIFDLPPDDLDFAQQASFNGFANAGRFRKEDWASVHDFGRILKYITYGRKEDHLYVNIGQRYATSIGHGELVRRYSPNIDLDYVRVSAEVDAYNDYAGFEFFTNDILQWNLLSAIAFVKPLSFFGAESFWAKSLSIGVSGALDWQAPYLNQTDQGVRLLTPVGCETKDPSGCRVNSSQRAVKLVGIDAEVKVVKTEEVDIKPYVDYSMLIDGSGGATLGALGRFNVGKSTVNAFRVVAELRYLGSHYMPSYFDTFYEIERFQFYQQPTRINGQIQYQTKQSYVMDTGLGNRAGFYLEASWGIRDAIGFTVSVDDNAIKGHNFVAHLEIPFFNFLQVFASYYKRGFDDVSEFGKFQDGKTILLAGARLKLLPFLFINGRAYQTYRLDAASARYTNQFGAQIDLEIGYEFKGGREPPITTGNTPATDSTPPPPEQQPAPQQPNNGTPPPPQPDGTGTPPPPQ